MRIAMVSEHASPLATLGGADAGGQNVHVDALARAIAARGIAVDVHTRRDDPDLPAWIDHAPGVRVHHVDAGPPTPLPKDELLPWIGEFASQLRRVWSRRTPDVVHSHFWMSGLAALEAAGPLGVPVVHTYHALGVVKRRYQGAADTSPPERLAIERRLANECARVVATCSDEAFELMRLGLDRSRLSIVPCGVDVARFGPAGLIAEQPPRRLPHRIISVGRLVERKGVGNVISALAELPDTELLVVGGPAADELDGDPEVRRLRTLAEGNGTSDRVQWLGRRGRDEVASLIRSSDLVICAPWYEPFGIVPLEAMACGVPVVASAVGGLIDTVVDGVTGRLVAPRAPDRLAEAIGALLEDPDARARMGAAGAARVRRRYDWSRIAEQTLELHRGVAARHERPGRSEPALPTCGEHITVLRHALDELGDELAAADELGTRLGRVLECGGRLLTAGNGGSAAQAQHLTAELVGRFMRERRPLSAICLHGDTSALTAIGNDYGAGEMFARQVEAHGRPGDVFIALSTSGSSANVLRAAEAAREAGMETWALTGAGPNPLAATADEALCLPAPSTATVQELHLIAIHSICAAVDRVFAERPARTPAASPSRRATSRGVRA